MSTIIDNITLALMSLKRELEDYLKDNGWRYCTIGIAGDDFLRGKEIVLKAEDKKKQIELPVITFETGPVRDAPLELGEDYSMDLVTISVNIQAADSNQLRTLSNLIRRKLSEYTFIVYDYRLPSRSAVGTALLTNTSLTDLSDWNQSNIALRHYSIVNTTMELTAQALI